MLLDKDKKKSTAWHLAVMWGHIELINKMWDCAKEVLTLEDLKNMIFRTEKTKGTPGNCSIVWPYRCITQTVGVGERSTNTRGF